VIRLSPSGLSKPLGTQAWTRLARNSKRLLKKSFRHNLATDQTLILVENSQNLDCDINGQANFVGFLFPAAKVIFQF
jgi:hypothetical protein